MRAENRCDCATRTTVELGRGGSAYAGTYSGGKLARIEIKQFRTRQLAAAGIAPASLIPQVVSPHTICVEQGCQWLHYVCRDAALRGLVASWHRLTPAVKTAIMELARGA
jgi:hypothetical protein